MNTLCHYIRILQIISRFDEKQRNSIISKTKIVNFE